MSTLYALLVGIDRYRSPGVPDLRGCRTDIDDALAYLQSRTAPGVDLDALVLSDGQATRAAVIGALRSHLGRARSADTALFWFSGHGSQAPAPRWWYAEPSHLVQTLVCADSRHGGVPDLLDKELSILLDDVARRAGHVAVVLDSCHSAGATRELEDREPGARARAVEPMPAPPARELLPELTGGEPASPPAPEHVVLAASRSHEAAQEMDLGGRRRGLFSWALLRALGRLGPTATYRDLLIAAQAEVERNAYRQVPQLVPPGRGIADRPFLGGRLAPPPSGLVLRYARDGWEVNAGSCHGLPPAPDATAGAVRVAVVGGPPAREAEVVQLLAERSLVEPVGWRPEPDRQYRVVLSRVPLPATTVAVDGADQDRATAAALLAALGTAGPDGGPSPHLRPVDPAGTETVPELRARTPSPGVVRVEDQHGVRLTGDLTGVVGGGARRAVRALEHIARWRQLRDLTNPVTGLAGAVAVEVVAARPGETIAPLTRPPVEADADGVVRLRYEPGPAGWVPPTVFVRLHNRSDRRLFCVLLDLTERFRAHANLFPGDYVAPGGRTAARRGRRVVASLPAGSVVEPGRRARDWLKLVVAEEQFSAEPFEMPALDDPRGTARGPLAVQGFLGRAVQHRDLVASAEDGAYDWATVTVPLVIEVPGPGD
ncbi:caspase family protein [Micromonospora sp. NBC_01655]|uniref:caspase family protein n=1 Tax=Micromonospora sp. NBC_01655 TaxID=2975983 RepID=UPI0022591DD5|nr:caspase family protein [Micromonospora sp. NBC_01655]MCX4473561.1 caspase family protein [Micromonospora sp. NBC_01655]